MKPYLIGCLLLWTWSCSTAPSPKSNAALTSEAKALVSDLSGTASLVNPGDAAQAPHLKRHVGQLLLANADTQILIPSAPPLSTGQTYAALLSKVYRRTDQQWRAIPWLPSLEIKLLDKSGGALQMIGQDLVQEGQSFTVHAFFRKTNAGAADAHLVLKIHPAEARLDVKVIGTVAKLPWTLRIGRGLGEDYAIPYKGNQVAGLTTSLLPQAVSIVGDQAFTFRQDEAFSYLESPAGAIGFKVLLARDALLGQLELVQSLSSCYGKGSTCLPPKVKARARQLASPPPKKGEPSLWQAAMFYTSQGSFRSLVPIREGETLAIPSASNERLDLFFRDAQSVLQKIALPLKSPRPITLPPMRKGSLQLNLSSGAPSFLEIRSAVQHNSKSLHAWVGDSDKILSPFTLLQTEWPTNLALPAADYHVRVYNADQILCDQRLTVLVDRKTPFVCNAAKLPAEYSARASISSDRVLIADAQLTATGIRVITSSEPAKEKSGIIAIPMLATYDAELGLSLRAFPIVPKTEDAWQAYRLEKSDRNTLTHFRDFIRQHDPEASLVLDCPPPGFQLAEYNWIVQTLKPDILEVFGCEQPDLSRELLQVANRLQQKLERPVRLAAASFHGSLFGAQVPSLFLSRFKQSAKLDRAQVIDELKQGRYTLGFRSELQIPPVSSADATMRLGLKSSDLKRQKVLVRIYDQDGSLSEQGFTIDGRAQSELPVPLRLKSTSRWLRVELLAAENSQQEESPLFILATSNFFGLDGKLQR